MSSLSIFVSGLAANASFSNVTSYLSSGIDLSAALQDAVDDSPVGGAIFIPPGPSGPWHMSKPVFLEKRILIFGVPGSTCIQMTTPICPFITGIPRATANAETIDASYVVNTNGLYGWRTKGNSWIQMQGIPAMLGAQSVNSGSTAMGDYWNETQEVTIDFIIGPDSTLWSPNQMLFGMGSNPNSYASFPFTLWTGQDTNHFVFAFRTADIGSSLTANDRLMTIPLTTMTPPYKIKIKLSLLHGTLNVFSMATGSEVAIPATSFVDSGNRSIDFGSGGMNFIQNTMYPFMIGAKGQSGPFMSTSTPMVIYGLRVTAGLVDDFNLSTPATNCIMHLPVIEPTTHDRTVAIGTGSNQGASGGTGIWFQCDGDAEYDGIVLEGLTLRLMANQGIGVVIGSVTDTTLRQMHVSGGAQAIGCYNIGSNYPLWLEDVRVQGFDCAVQGFDQILKGFGLTCDGGGLDTMRFAGCDVELSGDQITHASSNAETFIRLQSAASGGTYDFSGFYVDNESFALRLAAILWEQSADTINELMLRNVNFSTCSGVPIIQVQRNGSTNSPTWPQMHLDYKGVKGIGWSQFATILGGAGGTVNIALDASGANYGYWKSP